MLLCLFSIIANAANCHYHKNIYAKDIPISFSNKIVVNPTLPVGSVITRTFATAISTNNQQILVVCQSTPKYQWKTRHQYPISPLTYGNETIYQTELAGIGLKIINHNNNYGSMSVPRILPNTPPCDNLANGKGFCGKELGDIEIQLIKTASEVTDGYIPSQILIESTIGNLPITRYRLTNTQIIVPKLSCSINNNALEINLGRLKTTVFNGMYSTAGKKGFYLELNCSHPSTVEMRMDGDTLPTSDDKILALNKYNAAQGIGLQILYENNPIKFNHWFILKRVLDTKSIPLFFYALYIQVAEQVTPGQANALVTYHIKYH